MSAPTVRSDYDQLKTVASSFSQQADALNQMIQNLNSCEQTLEGGDWIGQGANAFFQEWGNQDLPILKRLQSAMTEAARATQQISNIMKQAEDNASRVFHI